MYLQHVHVQNFRNLLNVEVTFHRGLNVLVGRNNIGKSNLLLALRQALAPAATLGEAPPWPDEEDLYREANGEPVSDTIRVSLTFADLLPEERALFVDMLDTGPDGDLSVVRLRYEAVWDRRRTRFRIERWGGPDGGNPAQVPNELVHRLPLTFLPALRDAEAALSPGYRSRLARLLAAYAREHSSEIDQERIVDIFRTANKELGETELLKRITDRVAGIASEMAGSDYAPVAIEAADPAFARILQALRIVIPGNPVRELTSSGLGYNNVLYIATVLAHLRQSPAHDTPILLIEEPEAHLHPQLVAHLGDYLSRTLVGMARPQVIVTTHSPTLASRVHPRQIIAMHARRDASGGSKVVCSSLAMVAMSDEETRQLRRFLDITRATLYFAKGLILVEGICEELILPHLARALGYDLAANHVSILPLCGVSTKALRSILHEEGFAIPTAIVTDGDPGINGTGWRKATPRRQPNGAFMVAPRVRRLRRECAGSPIIRVFVSDVTLEYDLAAAGELNPLIMAECWERYYPGGRTLRRADVEAADPGERPLLVWRGICRAAHSASKAGFAHVLAEWLEQHSDVVSNGGFGVPKYLKDAFAWVCPKARSEVASVPALL